MTKNRLFVHIGSHKTGTTSIQHALRSNNDALAAAGYVYFSDNRVSAERSFPDLHSWVGCIIPGQLLPQGMCFLEPERLCQILGGLPHDVIISSENLSFIFSPEPLAEFALHARQHFNEIKIICYLRRQDRHMVSHHQEGSRLHRRWENQLFGHEPRALPTFSGNHLLYLDYHQRLVHWAEIFGAESLRIRIFEPSQLTDGDAVADFMALLGIHGYVRPDRLNTSRGFFTTKIGHLVNGSGLRNPEAVLAALGNLPEEPTRLVPSREQAVSYMSHFKESNTQLARFLGINHHSPFDADFTEYDEQEGDLWDERRADLAFRKILGAFDAFLESRVADDLREAAKAVRHHNPTLAARLLTTALRFRPGGPVIQKLLKELETVQEESVAEQDGLTANCVNADIGGLMEGS
jgi:hypothetical protein